MPSGPPPSAAGPSNTTSTSNTVFQATQTNFYHSTTQNRYYTGSQVSPHAVQSSDPDQPYPTHYPAQPIPSLERENRSVSPSPPPPPPPKHWDGALSRFLSRLGLSQALHGLEKDMIILNRAWEKEQVRGLLEDLISDLRRVLDCDEDNVDVGDGQCVKDTSLDDRKLAYVPFRGDVEKRSHTSITKEISTFLATNRARNDASNRREFLISLAERHGEINVSSPPSCARTDANPSLNRDLQMKYDIARNEDGPLRRTVLPSTKKEAEVPTGIKRKREEGDDGSEGNWTAGAHPGLDVRLKNVEEHLNVKYVPTPPSTLLARLKFLEDHIIQLEKEHPPWAALHFNQPHRGWPPPPRPTPIIVPVSMRTGSGGTADSITEGSTQASSSNPPGSSAQGIGKRKNNPSTLHRAVMEKLEIKRAREDLAGHGMGEGVG